MKKSAVKELLTTIKQRTGGMILKFIIRQIPFIALSISTNGIYGIIHFVLNFPNYLEILYAIYNYCK